MLERRIIRVLVTPNMTSYFLDGARQQGITYELLRLFENEINEGIEQKHLRTHVIIIPTSRDLLIPGLRDGMADIAAANLTITAERLDLVDFSAPLATQIKEIVVSGPGAPTLESLEDLAGQEVFVRRSSSYWESLERLNGELRAAGLEEIRLLAADELLETESILEMVNSGLVPITVADSYLADFWAQIYEDLVIHPELTLRAGGKIAWAFRKQSPRLESKINEFVREHRKGSLLGNILLKRYLRSTQWVENSHSEENLRRFDETLGLFQRYCTEYDFDYLMVAAQGYQESGLDQSKRSSAGAVGIMQLLPSTAADPNVGIPNIEEREANIHAGVRYLRFITDRYFTDEPMDDLNKTLFAFAAYNAGPARVSRLRRQAAEAGLDPNVWFRNVEVVAAREIGRETVQYVSNIFKYYVAYRMIENRRQRLRTSGEEKS
jgi:membrane-bound lytic murein transglycosylase MltF